MLWILAVLIVGFGAYVRLAPSDPARWHVDPLQAADPGRLGALQRSAGSLEAFETAILAEPRTRLLAGGAAEGRATYVARSLVWGFPDYITAAADGPDVVVLSRLRFGGSDVGVNAARLERLFKRLNPPQ